MYFKLWHPTFPQYSFKLYQVEEELEQDLNRLGPVKIVAGTYDWPDKYYSFRGWTDKINSLWWPDGADNFSTCVLLIDDSRNDVLAQLVEAQKAQVNCWHWPYVILSCLMQPNRGLVDGTKDQYRFPADAFPQGGQISGVTAETARVEWKMYPLQPVSLSNLPNTEKFRGLWLLPLVDARYFYRNVPLNAYANESSSSSCGTEPGYPIIEIDNAKTPNWMPPLRGYSQDATVPSNFAPIAQNGTWPSINGSMRWGTAADLQARMENWRVVNRDVRSIYTISGGGGTPHSSFTGVLADYPEDWSIGGLQSYHLDACNYQKQSKARLSGGLCDSRSLDELTARKLQFTFRVGGTDAFYCVTIAANTDFPATVADLVEDADGPSPDESKIIPLVDLGVPCSSRSPSLVEKSQLVVAAKQWALLYYAWRHQQAFMTFPNIYPLIPNGHSKVIRWDFGGDTHTWRTTYIAVEGVQGTDQSYAVERQPFYAQIDGEGKIADGLHGFYAFTELQDANGQLTNTLSTPRRGFVLNINSSTQTINPARDENGKVGVPVGMTVWMKPGVPYLDTTTGQIFDHYLFTTGDLLQVIVPKGNGEVNKFGHIGATIMVFDPVTHALISSKDVWGLVLQ